MENGQKVVSCIYVNGYSLGKITKKVARNVTERQREAREEGKEEMLG